MKMFVDLDGVLTGFEDQFFKHFGLGSYDFKDKFELENPGGDYRPTFWKMISEIPNFWFDMPFTTGGKNLWNHVKKYKPTILTALPEMIETDRAKEQKKKWVEKNLGEEVPVLFVKNSMDNHKYSGKEIHCNGPEDMLIDDSLDNIKAWKAKGGTGLRYVTSYDIIKKLKDMDL